jgi:hypothetical protein
MLTQLSTIKARLAIDDTDVTKDDLLTSAIKAVSARFDKETNRTLARSVNATHEFDGGDTQIIVACYPVESVSKFELKYSEAEGWLEQTGITFLIRRSSIISLQSPLSTLSSQLSTCRVTYTGGYVLPGTEPGPGQFALSADLEQAAIEQVAAWYLHRDKVGLELSWPKDGTYQRLSQLPFLPPFPPP